MVPSRLLSFIYPGSAKDPFLFGPYFHSLQIIRLIYLSSTWRRSKTIFCRWFPSLDMVFLSRLWLPCHRVNSKEVLSFSFLQKKLPYTFYPGRQIFLNMVFLQCRRTLTDACILFKPFNGLIDCAIVAEICDRESFYNIRTLRVFKVPFADLWCYFYSPPECFVTITADWSFSFIFCLI